MKDLLTFIIGSIVVDRESVSIEEHATGEGTVTFTIAVPASEAGKIIGKGGKTIRAIRSLLSIRAVKEQKQVYVDVRSSDSPSVGTV